MKTWTVLFFVGLAVVITGMTTTAADKIDDGSLLEVAPAVKKAIQFYPAIPLPQDVRIVPFDDDGGKPGGFIPGVWMGAWEDVLPHILIVEEIRHSRVMIIYAHGIAPIWKISIAGWIRAQGIIEDDVLTVQLPWPTYTATVTYRMNQSGMLSGVYKGPGIHSRIIMRQVQE